MKVSIFDLEKVKAEVERRQNECHEEGVSYVAFDRVQGATIEYLPNGDEVILSLSEQYSKNVKKKLQEKSSSIKADPAKSRRAVLRNKKREDEKGSAKSMKRVGSI